VDREWGGCQVRIKGIVDHKVLVALAPGSCIIVRVRKTKILFLAPMVKGDGADSAKECREIKEQVSGRKWGGSLKFELVLGARWEDLVDQIWKGEHDIVHFSGHGSTNGDFIVRRRDENMQPVASEWIGEAFGTKKGRSRLAVFNCCHSAGMAAEATKHIDAAVWMDREIGDQAAIEFAVAFYGAIASGAPLRAAFEQARLVLKADEVPQDKTPRIFAKLGVRLEDIILVRHLSLLEVVVFVGMVCLAGVLVGKQMKREVPTLAIGVRSFLAETNVQGTTTEWSAQGGMLDGFEALLNAATSYQDLSRSEVVFENPLRLRADIKMQVALDGTNNLWATIAVELPEVGQVFPFAKRWTFEVWSSLAGGTTVYYAEGREYILYPSRTAFGILRSKRESEVAKMLLVEAFPVYATLASSPEGKLARPPERVSWASRSTKGGGLECLEWSELPVLPTRWLKSSSAILPAAGEMLTKRIVFSKDHRRIYGSTVDLSPLAHFIGMDTRFAKTAFGSWFFNFMPKTSLHVTTIHEDVILNKRMSPSIFVPPTFLTAKRVSEFSFQGTNFVNGAAHRY
jgi:CHAT domain